MDDIDALERLMVHPDGSWLFRCAAPDIENDAGPLGDNVFVTSWHRVNLRIRLQQNVIS
jgi:hypothetical protein